MIDWIDWGVVTTPGFVILAVGAWAATILGWMWTRKSEMEAFSIPTLLIVLLVELGAAYYFVSKG